MVEQNLNGKKICVLPFIHLATHPTGVVTPCCQSDMNNGFSFAKEDNILKLGDNSIKDILNSRNFNLIRKKMVNNEIPDECLGCFTIEKNGGVSKRYYENNRFNVNNIESLINNTGELNNINLKFIELRLGNLCNLKCISCNPMSSSKWREDISYLPEKFQSGYYTINTEKNEWFKNKEWYDELIENSKDLEEIYINGGEPMIIKEHFYFLKKLDEIGKSKEIKLTYSINLTTLPNDIVELWKNFKSVELNVSIDDLGKRNNYIRYPSDFNEIENNLYRLLEKNFKVKIIQTLSVLNIFNVANFYNYFSEKGIIIEHNYVYLPEYLHVSLLNDVLKSKLNLDGIPIDKQERIMIELNKNYNEFQSDFIEYINLIDKIRGISINEYITEFK